MIVGAVLVVADLPCAGAGDRRQDKRGNAGQPSGSSVPASSRSHRRPSRRFSSGAPIPARRAGAPFGYLRRPLFLPLRAASRAANSTASVSAATHGQNVSERACQK